MHISLSDYVPEDARFAKTTALIEATDFEMSTLWSRHSTASVWYCEKDGKPDIDWKEDARGRSCEVGAVVMKKSGQDRWPICVQLTWATLNGQLVCFWSPSSQFVDYKLIEAWFEQAFPKNVRTTDAQNFHLVLRR